MSEFVEFPTSEGESVLVEVERVAGGAVTRGYGADEVVVKAQESLGSVLGRIGPAVQGIVDQLRATGNWPDEVVVEFAVRISADSNVIIARAGGEANFRVSTKWTKPRAE